MISTHSIILKPCIEYSILNQFVKVVDQSLNFNNSDVDADTDLNQLKLKRTHVLPRIESLKTIFSSFWYNFLFMICTPILLLITSFYQLSLLQNYIAFAIFFLACFLNIICSLNRMDRSLIRCLTRRFDWYYLCFVLINFVIWSALSEEWIHSSSLNLSIYVLTIAPISLVVLHLDAIPVYPLLSKLLVIVVGLLMMLRFLFFRNLIWSESETKLAMMHFIHMIPGFFTTNSKVLTNIAAWELTMYLLQQFIFTIESYSHNFLWKPMTLLRLPLLLLVQTDDFKSYKLEMTTELDGYQSAQTTIPNSYFQIASMRFGQKDHCPDEENGLMSWKQKYVIVGKENDCQVETNFSSSDNCLLRVEIPFSPMLHSVVYHRTLILTRTFTLTSFILVFGFWLISQYASHLSGMAIAANTLICIAIYIVSELQCFDRRICFDLVKNFEVIVYIFQMLRILCVSAILFQNSWLFMSLACLWTAISMQVVFLDGAILYSAKFKAFLTMMSIVLSLMLLHHQIFPRGFVSLKTIFVFSCIRIIIFQIKYLLRSVFWPKYCSVLSAPLHYKIN